MHPREPSQSISLTMSVNLKDYQIFRHDYIRGRIASDGVATFVHKSIYSEEISINNTHLQQVTTKIHLTKTNKITICNLYIP